MRVIDLSFPIGPHFRWAATSEPLDPRGGAELPVHRPHRELSRLHPRGRAGALPARRPRHRVHAGRPVDVRGGDIVLLRTDWPARCPVESERFWKDAPYTGRGACEWLVARGVKRWATTIRPTTASAPPSSRRARASRGRSAPRITSSSRAASP